MQSWDGVRAKLTSITRAGPFYRVAPPLSEAEVTAIEARIGTALPSEYREFVTLVAAEADIGLRLHHPELATRHLHDPRAAYPAFEERAPPDLDLRHFPIAPGEAVDVMTQIAAAFGPAPRDTAYGQLAFVPNADVLSLFVPGNPWSAGALSIADTGCGWADYLVIDGPLAGTVWHSGDAGWLPACHDAGGSIRAHGYKSWLESALAAN